MQSTSQCKSAVRRTRQLQRQLQRLQARNVSSLALDTKYTQLAKAEWRQARVADFGRKTGHKHTVTRSARANAAISL